MTQLPAPQYPRPPANVETYVDALGYETTIEFLLAFGGAELNIPDNPRSGSALVNTVGASGVKRLAERRHLLQRRVPLATPWLARCFHVRGMSLSYIARRLRRSDHTIRRYLNSDRPDYGGKV